MKNNLQQIEGLIAMESGTLSDPEARHALSALSGRVRAMGAVHQRLISSNSVVELAVSGFMSDLCRDIGRSHNLGKRSIRLDVQVDDSKIHIERAVIVGLLVNELVTNALKHAFPNGRSGVVTVRYGKEAAGTVLEVADDGVGLDPERGAADAARHLGLRLIDGFADQLNGTMEFVSDGGTRARLVLG